MPTISKRTVDDLIASAQPGTLRDADLKGFVARLNRDGSVTYLYEYRAGRFRTAPYRRMSIGKHGMFTPTTAREEAKKLQARVRLGEDPARERAVERGMPTLAAFAQSFLDAAAAVAKDHPENAKLRPRTIGNYRSYLRVHVAPALGSRRLDTLTRGDIEHLHHQIGQKHPATANRVIEFIGSLWRAACAKCPLSLSNSPATGIKAFKERARERFLSKAELVRLGEVLREAETIGIPMQIDDTNPSSKHAVKDPAKRLIRIDPFAVAAIRLLIVLGARRNEVLHARWSDIDFDRQVLTVFGKTGRRPILLSPPALAILDDLPRMSPYVIPGDDPSRPRADLNRPWRTISRHAGLKGVRLHDLRHSYASVLASGGASLPIIGKLMGHTQHHSTQRYVHLAEDPVRAAHNQAGAYIATALLHADHAARKMPS